MLRMSAGILVTIFLCIAQSHGADLKAKSVQGALSPPNIVLIISDDQGYADLQVADLAHDVKTPNLDRLANMGVRFKQAYVSAPICNASRAGLATGSYQQRFGVWWYGGEGLRDSKFQTIAEVLKGQGYRTGYFGKFHYGSPQHESRQSRNFPLNHGFDELFGFSGGRKHYLFHDDKSEQTFRKVLTDNGIDTGYEGLQMQPFWVNDVQKDQFGFSTELIGKAARDFMKSSQDKPFFAQIAFNAVHNFTHQLPKDYLEKKGLTGFPGDWDPAKDGYLDWYKRGRFPHNPEGRAQYLGHLEYLDQEIGKIMTHLEKSGMMKNTLVVYISDNGGSTPIGANNSPFRGSKYTLYEGGIRVPMIIAAPGRVKGGRVVDNMVSSLDLLPTLAAMGGAVQAVRTDGMDLTPLLSGQNNELSHEALVWDTGREIAVRYGRWKYRAGGDLANARIEMVDLERGEHLHDLEKDPGERFNLIESQPEILRKMKEIHSRWKLNVVNND
ncbi:sulfatase [Paremcibacter congregatus]|uniref:sulfatase family protein n=1 Tax=Paremcibacter congregatus TaxID=2043170 RepID=UPI003A94F68B